MSAVSSVTAPPASPAIAPTSRANLRPPWPKGFCPNPGGKGSRYHETQALARQAAPDAMRPLIELIDEPDPRVATVASNAVLDRAFGKPRDINPDEGRERPIVDIDRLSPEHRELLLALFRSGAVKVGGE